MIAALTLLPALLTIAGRRVDRLRIPGLGKREPSTAEDTRWFRWSREIQRAPGALGAALRRPADRSSASRPSRCGSAPTTPAPTPPARRRAKPTTCSPRASAPASTAPSRWSRRCRRKGDDAALVAAAARRSKAKKGSPTRTPIDAQPGQEHRRLPGLPDDLAAERGDDRTARPHPRRRPAADRAEDRRPAPRRRHHRDLRGLRQRDLRKAAALHRRRRAALGAAADDRLPLGAGAAEGDGDEPAQHRRRLRPDRRRLPVGLGREPHRRRRHRPDHLLLPGLPLRDRLRPLDGLRGLPDVADPRGVGAQPRRDRSPSPAASP